MNIQQKKRLDKLEKEDFFLLKFAENKFYISGSTKNVYTIDWFMNHPNNLDSSFFCNCPDMKSHAKNYNIYCKHICFIYHKIGKFNRPEFYENKMLNEEESTNLKNKLDKINSGILLDNSIQNIELIEKFMSKASINDDELCFSLNKFNKCITEDDCPICFDNFVETEYLFCQSCGNVVHKKCIEKWLQTNHNCIFCRSNIWKYYGKKNKEKYMNLK
jgi:hypothetical protein